jgi:beta-phosphoglucomutase-like phosphatase (HAD superfamily)
MNAYDVARVIYHRFSPALSLTEGQAILRDSFSRNLGRISLSAMLGALECVQRLARRAPLAVASGSPLRLIEMALERTGIFNI